MKSHIVKPNFCPACGYFSDTASVANGNDAVPKPGDISICLNCGAANIFGESMMLRPLTALDLMQIPDDQRDLLRRAKTYAKLRGPIPRKETRQ